VTDDRIDELLDLWQVLYAAGRDVPADELCRDCPELADEVGRRLAVLRFALRPAGSPDAATSQQDDTPDTPALGRVHDAAPPAAPELPGFRPVRLLGEGGMGAVWAAEDAALGRPVAVKVMRPELAARTAARQRFLREARSAAAVRHDHVVPIYHVGEAPAGPFLVMPLLAGESLDARLRRDPAVPPAEAARVAAEAAAGLAAAHARGLVHRDVKPANLWLDSDTGRVLVLDFGLARAADGGDGLTHTGAVMGTPGYMAPEQADGGEVDHRADLFSLGCVLYRMLAGRPAFDGKSAMSVLLATAERDPPPPHAVNPAVPAGLSAFALRLLAKDPTARPASAGEVAAELRRLAADPTATYAPAAPPPARRGPRRRQAALLAAALAGVAGVAAVGVLVRPGGGPPPDPGPAAPLPAVPPAVAPADPLRVLAVEVEHFASRPGGAVEPLGPLGQRSFAATLGDRVRVRARLSRPGYAYVLACQADGWVDLCFPESEAEPPPLTAEPAYPWADRGKFYGLREGAGMWVFAVLASAALILHGDDKSVARLTAREVLETWTLDADLVTLSACETGLGRDAGGDGLLGFAQAFLAAGARTVCLSLWRVDDAATALLMDRFYRNLLGKRDGLEKPMPKAAALAEAKRWLRELSQDDAARLSASLSGGVARGKNEKAELLPPKAGPGERPFAHPRYWAAFVLVGDPD
jgi:hypothetical protein